MTTINATKRELMNTINGLFAVQEVEGKRFGIAVSKNIEALKKALKDVEEFGRPSPEFRDLALKVNELAEKNTDEAREEIKQLEKDNPDLLAARETQMAAIEDMLNEEASVELQLFDEDLLPDNMTGKQINGIHLIIK
tara:strand:- start:329 stop:742 length:414 start_codon:yes stop_codon:yes gene_type:complete